MSPNHDSHDGHIHRAAGNKSYRALDIGNYINQRLVGKISSQWSKAYTEFMLSREALSPLPDGSWAMLLGFKLLRPFTSASDDVLHPYDKKKEHELHNPLVRDQLTGLPIVKATAWKGNLRLSALMSELDSETIARLFGVVRKDDTALAGRLRFFTTFFPFNERHFEVVTPLNRETRTPVRGPIFFEVVPESEEGTFSLLYVPYPRGKAWDPRQVGPDLEAASKAVRSMFIDHGFSAKKTLGWGVAKDELLSRSELVLKGAIWEKADLESLTSDNSEAVKPDDELLPFMDENGQPLEILKTDGGMFKSNKKYKEMPESDKPGGFRRYTVFRTWYQEHGENWTRRAATTGESDRERIESIPIGSFSELQDVSAKLARAVEREKQ